MEGETYSYRKEVKTHMNIQKSIKVILTSAALTAVAAGASFAQGNLAPNSTIVPSATTLNGVLITSQTQAFVAPTIAPNPPNYSGSLYSAVYRETAAANPLGGLTFVFQITNNAGSIEPLDRFTDQSFSGFQTSAFYDASSGTIAPSNAFRLGSVTPGFRLEATTGNSGIGALVGGTTSDLLVIRTDAPSYILSLAGVSDGNTVNPLSYQPASLPSSVPEPASLVPFALGGLGLLGLIARKTRRTSGAAA